MYICKSPEPIFPVHIWMFETEKKSSVLLAFIGINLDISNNALISILKLLDCIPRVIGLLVCNKTCRFLKTLSFRKLRIRVPVTMERICQVVLDPINSAIFPPGGKFKFYHKHQVSALFTVYILGCSDLVLIFDFTIWGPFMI